MPGTTQTIYNHSFKSPSSLRDSEQCMPICNTLSLPGDPAKTVAISELKVQYNTSEPETVQDFHR